MEASVDERVPASDSGSFPCPICGGRTFVKDSRPHGGGVWRQRRCSKCTGRFGTYETVWNAAKKGLVPALQALIVELKAERATVEPRIQEIDKILGALQSIESAGRGRR